LTLPAKARYYIANKPKGVKKKLPGQYPAIRVFLPAANIAGILAVDPKRNLSLPIIKNFHMISFAAKTGPVSDNEICSRLTPKEG